MPGVEKKTFWQTFCRRVGASSWDQEPLPKGEAVPTEEWLRVRAANGSLARAPARWRARTATPPFAWPGGDKRLPGHAFYSSAWQQPCHCRPHKPTGARHTAGKSESSAPAPAPQCARARLGSCLLWPVQTHWFAIRQITGEGLLFSVKALKIVLYFLDFFFDMSVQVSHCYASSGAFHGESHCPLTSCQMLLSPLLCAGV